MKKYQIFNDLSNVNRKRLDLFEGSKIEDVVEFKGYKVTVEEAYQNGNCMTHYVTLEKAVKTSGKLEFSSNESDENGDNRSMTAYITLTNKSLNEDQLYNIFNDIMNIFEYDFSVNFHRCPDFENGYYCDGISFLFEYGEMTQLKNDIKKTWKKIKKDLRIR